MAATFFLLLVLVQVSTAMTARSAADAAVAAAAREASLPGANLGRAATDLSRVIEGVVPGAGDIEVGLRVTNHRAIAVASFRWTPPGPVLTPLTISVRSDVPRVFEP